MKRIQVGELDTVIEGINAVKSTYKLLGLKGDDYRLAAELYSEGHRDLVDNLLYASALNQSLKLLTLDRELIDFMHRKSHATSPFIGPEEL